MNYSLLTFFGLLISLPLFSQQYYPSIVMGDDGHREYPAWQGSANAIEGLLRSDGTMLLAGTGYWSTCNCYRLTMAVVDTVCGALDPSFGSGGVTTVQFEGRSLLQDVTIQLDEKIVGCGITAPSNGFSGHKPAVYRLLPNGMPDSTFHGSGFRKESFDPVSSGAFWQVFALPDGRITCLGASVPNINGGTSALGAMRFNPDGSMDNAFSGDGKTTLNLSGMPYTNEYNIGTGLMMPDGSIIGVGLFTLAGSQTIGMFRIDSTGVFDTTFGNNGLNISPVVASSDVSTGGMSALLDNNGKILVSGTSDFTNGEFLLARFHSNGDVDSTYATNGVSTVPIGSNALGRRFELLPDGSSLQYGSFNWNNGIARMVKRLPDGNLDTSFGSNGIASPATPLFKQVYGGMQISNGRILAWGGGGNISFFKLVSEPEVDRFADLGPDLTGCTGDSVQLSVGMNIQSQMWNTGDTTATINVNTTGGYSAVLVNSDECVDKDTVHVEFYNPPATPSISVSGVDMSTIAVGDLQWFLNGSTIAGATQSTLTATVNGDYTVTVTDTNGCSSSSAIVQISTVGITETDLADLRVFPNPAEGLISIRSSQVYDVAYLLDGSGRHHDITWAGPTTFDVRSVESGYYQLVLLDKKGRRFVVPLIVD